MVNNSYLDVAYSIDNNGLGAGWVGCIEVLDLSGYV